MANQVKLGSDYKEIWEDSMLIALRDMQWVNGRKPLRNDLFPELLLKLDGKAESMAGDVLYALSGQMFLFELKASRDDMGTEPTKYLPKLFHKLDSTLRSLLAIAKPSDDQWAECSALLSFRSASWACHHMVWASLKGRATQQVGSSIVQQEMELYTQPYYDIARLFITKPKSKPIAQQTLLEVTYDGYLSREGRHTTDGLTAAGMAAYLKILALHSGTKGDCPMKAVIWSTTGFMWPCYDLTDLPALIEVLGAVPDKFPNGKEKSVVDYFNQMAQVVDSALLAPIGALKA